MDDMLLTLAGLALFVLMLGGVAGLAKQGESSSSEDIELINKLRRV